MVTFNYLFVVRIGLDFSTIILEYEVYKWINIQNYFIFMDIDKLSHF